MKKITLHDFNEASHSEILATGVGIYPCLDLAEVCWVAVKGGADDWAIYYQRSWWNVEAIKNCGEKVSSTDCILSLVDVEDFLLEKYRR